MVNIKYNGKKSKNGEKFLSGEVIIKEVDNQGRIVIPSKWRKKYDVKKVKVIIKGEELIIKPVKAPKLTELFDSIEIDVSSPLTDWKRLKKELLTGETD